MILRRASDPSGSFLVRQGTEATTKAVAACGSLRELTNDQLVTILDAEHAAARNGARLAVIRELDQRGHAVASGATNMLRHHLHLDFMDSLAGEDGRDPRTGR